MSLFKKAVFISGETLENDKTNQLREILKRLNFSFKDIQGKYQGVAEKSFMVKIQNEYQSKQLKSIGKQFSQDSILHLDNGKSTLEYCESNERVEIGTMRVDGTSTDYSIIDGVKYSIK